MSFDQDYDIILNSEKFDEKFYKKEYELDNDTDPIYHYLVFGTERLYNPSAEFDTEYYLNNNKDVKDSNINPFVHYIKWGEKEGRTPKMLNYEEFKNIYFSNQHYVIGQKNYLFDINDSNCEIMQHFDSESQHEKDYNLFFETYEFKKDFFKKHKIDYEFIVIPDKTIVCENLLPFKHDNIYRVMDKLDLYDFSKYLNETHYFKLNNQLNIKGGETLFLEFLSLFDKKFNINQVNNCINNHELELFEYPRQSIILNLITENTEKIIKDISNEDLFIPRPLNLNMVDIPDFLKKYFEKESTYYYNKDSISELRVLVFYNSEICTFNDFLPFYFREVFLFYDYGILNTQLIKWFNPDIILELRNENFLNSYIDSLKTLNYSTDFFLENQEFVSPKLNLIDNVNSNNKKISVIIPVFNVEKYLEQCLDSVIHQTLDDLEIICVNDGSTDNSLNILKRYAKNDNRITIINTENHGQGVARNYALEKATGQYIFFLDSDDWIREDALELLYEKASKFKLDMLFYPLINYLNHNGELVNDSIYDHVCFKQNKLDEKEFFIFADVTNNIFEIPVCTCSKLYDRLFLEKYDFKFPEGIFYEDNVFFYDVFFNSEKNGFLNEHLLYRRRHPDSTTGKFSKKQIDMVSAMNKTIQVFIKNKQYDLFKRKLINHTFANIISLFNRVPLYLKQMFFEKIKNEFIGFNELKNDFENNLTLDKKIIFELFIKHELFLKFDSEYKLSTSKYEIYYNNKFISSESAEYLKLKQNEKYKNYEIGIVIPIYNNGYLTHRTLMSILNQTFKFEDIEVILINDNSNDATFDLINEYADKYSNIKAIHMKKSSGSSGTPRNVGIKECSAKYIMFLDHDDFFELDALEKLYAKIISTNSDVVFGTYTIIEQNKMKKVLLPKEKHGYFKYLNNNERFVAYPAPSIWTKLFNTDFIKKHDILFPTILGEDAIFMMEVLINSKGIFYLWDTNICYHDLRDSSTTNNVSLKYMEELFVSEIYMQNYFESLNKYQYREYRASATINFVFNQLTNCKFGIDKMVSLFEVMEEFVGIYENLNIKPSLPKNRMIFDLILSGDYELLTKLINDEI